MKIKHNSTRAMKAGPSKAGKQGHIASHTPSHVKKLSVSKKVKGC